MYDFLGPRHKGPVKTRFTLSWVPLFSEGNLLPNFWGKNRFFLRPLERLLGPRHSARAVWASRFSGRNLPSSVFLELSGSSGLVVAEAGSLILVMQLNYPSCDWDVDKYVHKMWKWAKVEVIGRCATLTTTCLCKEILQMFRMSSYVLKAASVWYGTRIRVSSIVRAQSSP